MRKYPALILLMLIGYFVHGQEFNCSVSVSAPQIQGTTEKRIFESLQQAMFEFVNNRSWSNYSYKPQERIECTILLTISEKVSSDEYKGKLNVVLRRPVYNTNYNSVLLNYIDKEVQFKYVEHEPLEFSDNTYTNNLTSTVAYYLYIFLGLDGDSFTLYGGNPYYEKAQAIVNTAQSSNMKGWQSFESQQNRYWLVENLLNSSYSPIREAMYKYHRLGLDLMQKNLNMGRESITKSLELLQKVNRERPGLFLVRLILEAKRDELVNIYKKANPQDKAKVINQLKDLDPANSSKYQGIMKDN